MAVQLIVFGERYPISVVKGILILNEKYSILIAKIRYFDKMLKTGQIGDVHL